MGGKAPLNLIAASADNVRGFWESCYIRLLNDYILKLAGSDWQDWRGVNPNWNRSAQADSMRAHAKLILMNEFGSTRLPVIKDPRMCKLMPFWFPVFAQIGWAPRIFLPLRSPLEVACSLQRRDGLALRHGCLLWLRHMLDAEADTRQQQRAVIVWEAFLDNWRDVMACVSAQIDVRWPRWSDAAFAQIDRFVSADLRHHRANEDDLCMTKAENEWVREAYAALAELAADPHAEKPQKTLDNIRADFDAATAAFGSAFHNFERAIGRLRVRANDNAVADRDDQSRELAKLQDNYEALLDELDARACKPVLRAHG